ncbi:MAG: ABC transporter substrate-binding protein [Lachnospiraceae bacterium]|nr:ABC transporter substrate-binding protein [Lachnospiraceae bacterium]
MKKIIALVLAALLIIGLLAACGGNGGQQGGGGQEGGGQESGQDGGETTPGEAAGEDIKFAVIAAITGNSASDGASMKNAVQMAVDEINAAGGVNGRMLVPDFIDGGSTADSALNVAQKVASDGSYTAIFGPHFSSQILAIGDTLSEAEIPVITGGTVKKVLETVTSDWVIRNRCPDTVVALASAKFMVEEMGVKKVGIFCANDDFGQGAADIVKEYFDSVGVEYVSETFNVDDNDVTSQCLKLKDAGVDSLFVWSLGTVFATVVRNIIEQGLNTLPIMASSALTFPDIQATLPTGWEEATKGWYVNTHWTTDLDDEASKTFVARYNELYGLEPNMLAAAWYSTTYWLKDCVERAGSTDPAALLKAMQETQGFETLSGTFNYADRDLIRQILILEQDGTGSFIFVQKVIGE